MGHKRYRMASHRFRKPHPNPGYHLKPDGDGTLEAPKVLEEPAGTPAPKAGLSQWDRIVLGCYLRFGIIIVASMLITGFNLIISVYWRICIILAAIAFALYCLNRCAIAPEGAQASKDLEATAVRPPQSRGPSPRARTVLEWLFSADLLLIFGLIIVFTSSVRSPSLRVAIKIGDVALIIFLISRWGQLRSK